MSLFSSVLMLQLRWCWGINTVSSHVMEECVVQQKPALAHAVGARGVQAAIQLGETESRVVTFTQCLQQRHIHQWHKYSSTYILYFIQLNTCIHSIQYVGQKKKIPSVQNMEEKQNTAHYHLSDVVIGVQKQNKEKWEDFSLCVWLLEWTSHGSSKPHPLPLPRPSSSLIGGKSLFFSGFSVLHVKLWSFWAQEAFDCRAEDMTSKQAQ